MHFCAFPLIKIWIHLHNNELSYIKFLEEFCNFLLWRVIRKISYECSERRVVGNATGVNVWASRCLGSGRQLRSVNRRPTILYVIKIWNDLLYNSEYNASALQNAYGASKCKVWQMDGQSDPYVTLCFASVTKSNRPSLSSGQDFIRNDRNPNFACPNIWQLIPL